MDEVLLRVETPIRYFAVLRQQNWERHERKHEEIAGHVPHVRATLLDPVVIIGDTEGCHHYYGLGYGTGPTVGTFLHVLVQHFAIDDEDEWTVVSAFFTRTIKKGELLWQRTSSS